MKKRVLVIDDDNDLIALVKLHLEENGFEVITANNGDEGIKKIKDDRSGFNLIILDIVMPDSDGFDFLAKYPSPRFPPVIIMTSIGVLRDFFNKIDVLDFIEKPVDVEFLTKKNIEICNDQCVLE